MLTYRRPIHFCITLLSLKFLLGRESDDVKLNIFSQELSPFKKTVARFLFRNCRVHLSDRNVGMLAAWQYLSSISERPIAFLLEDDWIALRNIKRSFNVSLQSIINEELDFIKLRLINDFDDFGFGKPDSCPWTVHGYEDLYTEFDEYFATSNKFVDFTFNPSMLSSDLLANLVGDLVDDVNDPTPLRSGENQIIKRWRLLPDLKVGQLKYGCFSHIGYRSRREYITRLPRVFYLLFTGKQKWTKS